MEKRIDGTDLKIIRALQQNGRMSNTEIAKITGIPETTVRYRLQRLINDEYIQIVAMANPLKLGFGVEGSIRIRADIKQIQQVGSALKNIDELYFIGRMMGRFDFDTEYYVNSMAALKDLIDRIQAIEGILETEVSTVLEYVKERYDWGQFQTPPEIG